MTEEEFRKLCMAHDITYEYSDDHRAWSKGSQEYREIHAAAAVLGADVAKPIWNECVDKKIIEGHREQFYWK